MYRCVDVCISVVVHAAGSSDTGSVSRAVDRRRFNSCQLLISGAADNAGSCSGLLGQVHPNLVYDTARHKSA